jgi:predicted nucleic acid-binding Zn ribbon protein
VRQLGGPDASSLSAIFSRWEEIAGPTLAEHSRPVRLDAETLVVAVDRPAWATQVRMLASSVLDRVGEIGGRVPGRLEVVVRPPDRSPKTAL